jgi:hypothetical protein
VAPPVAATPTAVPAKGAPPPAALGSAAAASQEPASWFYRPPLTLSVGEGRQRWRVTFFGFIEADYISDSTRSYNDSIGSALVARSDTYDGKTGRTQFSMRNTRIGLAFESPAVGGAQPSAVFEGDFFGNQPSTPPNITESSYFSSPTFRVRHAYFKLQDDFVDVLAGQTYNVFGWQNYFFSCSAEFLGLPNQVFSRNTQFRLSHAFNAGPLTIEVAAAAERPAQRDSQVPDFDGGVRIAFNGWKGISTPGNVGTRAVPLSIGISGITRQFKVNAFTPPPAQASNTLTGQGFSLDALVPIIPAADDNDRGWRATLTASYVKGTGIADLLTTGGGVTFPTLPNPAQANPPPTYSADVDNGLVTFDSMGVLHTIDWEAWRVGLQLYLLSSGRLILAGNYTQSHSNNLQKLFPQGGSEIALLGTMVDTSKYADVNLFFDATPAVRFGVSGQWTEVEYLGSTTTARDKPHNVRGMGQAVYVF